MSLVTWAIPNPQSTSSEQSDVKTSRATDGPSEATHSTAQPVSNESKIPGEQDEGTPSHDEVKRDPNKPAVRRKSVRMWKARALNRWAQKTTRNDLVWCFRCQWSNKEEISQRTRHHGYAAKGSDMFSKHNITLDQTRDSTGHVTSTFS